MYVESELHAAQQDSFVFATLSQAKKSGAEDASFVEAGAGALPATGTKKFEASVAGEELTAQHLLSKLPKPSSEFDPHYGWSRVPRDNMARVEDCVGCIFVWNQVEMDVGESKFNKMIHDSFFRNAVSAQGTPIFYPVVRCTVLSFF